MSTPIRARVGRPALGAAARSINISVKLSPAKNAIWRDAATRAGSKSLSAWIIEAADRAARSNDE